MQTAPTIALALLAVNALTIYLFWYDKKQAVAGLRRIPEKTLLTLAAIGGSVGALLAQRVFRHKTRKQPFATLLLLIALIHAGLLGAYGSRII